MDLWELSTFHSISCKPKPALNSKGCSLKQNKTKPYWKCPVGQMQHMPAGSSYQFVTSDLIEHPHFTDRKAEELRRQGTLAVCKTKWEQGFPSQDAGDLPNKGRGTPGRSAAGGKRGSWGQTSAESFGSGQAGWAEMPQQVVRASKSPDPLSVHVYLARDQAASQLGLNQIHWVGYRKEWTLMTLVCALEQDKTQGTGAAICRAQAWNSGTVSLR